MISVSGTKTNDIAKAIAGLSLKDKTVRRVFYSSMGRSITRAKSRIAKDLASELKLPIKVIRKRLLLYKKKTSDGQDYKIWAGLNDIPLGALGNLKKVGKDVVVRGVRADNAFIVNGIVYLRDSGNKARLEIEENVSQIINQRLPYYFDSEFKKNFEQALRYKFR